MAADLPYKPDHIYVWITELPEAGRPCMVSRSARTTLLAIHPGVSRLSIIDWANTNLSDWELNLYRAAYGQPPVGQPMQEWIMQGETFPTVPPAIDADLPAVSSEPLGA